MKNPGALIVAALLIIVVAIWLGLKIPRGILTYQDELFTAERAREMLIMGRDTVYYNFQHSFAKPPLQYWLTTLTLPRLANATWVAADETQPSYLDRTLPAPETAALVRLRRNPRWRLVFEEDGILLFRRVR